MNGTPATANGSMHAMSAYLFLGCNIYLWDTTQNKHSYTSMYVHNIVLSLLFTHIYSFCKQSS